MRNCQVRKVVLRCSNCENVEEVGSAGRCCVISIALGSTISEFGCPSHFSEVYVEGGFTAAHIPAACKGNALRAGCRAYRPSYRQSQEKRVLLDGNVFWIDSICKVRCSFLDECMWHVLPFVAARNLERCPPNSFVLPAS